MYGWMGDHKDKLELVLYCDADLAGDRTDAKSTSGVFVCLYGPNSFMPLAAVSKKQTPVSKSTPEAEIVAIDHGLCKHALPALSLWENLLDKNMTIRLMEDNSAACRIVITGRNPSMRHMSRTQRIDVAWLNERYSEKTFVFVECPTEYQAGDIMTKHFTDSKVWDRNLSLIGHFRDHVFHKAFAKAGCAGALVTNDDMPIGGLHMPVPTDTSDTYDSDIAPAAVAKVMPPRFYPYVVESKTQGYTMIEYCCFEDSLLGDPRFHKGLCRIIKITEELDARSPKAIELMRLVCKQDGKRVILWSAIPCTGGCTWNFINGMTPEGQNRINEHVALMVQLLERFVCIAKLVMQNGGIICFEWPGRCTYWNETLFLRSKHYV